MVKLKPSFFEMHTEGTHGQAIELVHAPLCIAPETFDTVDETFARGELIGSVVHSETLVETDINLTVLTRPAVRMNDRSRNDVAPNNSLQHDLGVVRHDFCVDHTLALEQTEDNRLTVGTTSSSTSNPVGTEIGLTHIIRSVQKRGLLTSFGQSLADLQVERIPRTKRDIRHFCSHSYRQIHRKTSHQLAKRCLADSRTAAVPDFSNHFRKLS